MTAFQIVKKSFRLITGNFQDFLRICAALYLLTYVVNAFATYAILGVWTLVTPDPINDIKSSVDLAIFIAPLAFSTVVGLWVAVAWHRYVLLEENPQGWIPRWNKSASISYFVQGLKLVLLFALLLILLLMLSFVAGQIVNAIFNRFIWYILTFAYTVLLICVFLRLCLVLNAVAIGKHLTMNQSWIATGPHSSSLILLSIVISMLSISLGKFSEFLGSNVFSSSVYFMLNILFGLWILSVMTTLYGSIIEGRDLEAS